MLTQTEVITRWNDIHLFDEPLVEVEDNPFSTYDAQSSQYIVEIKSRDKLYDSWIIEKQKFDSNIDKSVETGKLFIYLTEYRGKIMTWNINKLAEQGYYFHWEIRPMPETTEFTYNESIEKEVGYLYEKDAKVHE